jgi:hypothetical protein
MHKARDILMSALALILFFGQARADTAVLVKTIVGPDTLTIFGASIAPVKNFRGTGEIDLLIGAYDRSGSIGSPGWAYMYYGGGAFDSLWDVRYHGEQGYPGDWTSYGSSVSYAGDFCADGYTDIVIGSPGYDAPNSNGRVYVYRGGPVPDTVPLWVLTGASFAGLGYAVHGLGDLDRDGCSDIIVGAPGDNGVGLQDGSARIFLGDSTMAGADSVADYRLWGAGDRSGENFGCSFSSGDFNGDGWVDVVVGAPGSTYDTSICGRVYLFYGSSAFDVDYDLYFDGRQKAAEFGRSISSGDFNNDGYDDVIVGEPGYNSSTGRAYIYLGGAAPDTAPALLLVGEQTGSFFGYPVCGTGDLNGDSIDDILITAGRYTNGTDTFAGRIYIYYGGSILDSVPHVIITGNKKNGLGWSLADCGDINNDGKREIAAYCNPNTTPKTPLKVLIYNVDVNGVVGWPANAMIPYKNRLFSCPNPFSDKSQIKYRIWEHSYNEIIVYNIYGQRVKTLFSGVREPGEHYVFWDGIDYKNNKMPGGVYFIKLETSKQTITNKLILIR